MKMLTLPSLLRCKMNSTQCNVIHRPSLAVALKRSISNDVGAKIFKQNICDAGGCCGVDYNRMVWIVWFHGEGKWRACIRAHCDVAEHDAPHLPATRWSSLDM